MSGVDGSEDGSGTTLEALLEAAESTDDETPDSPDATSREPSAAARTESFTTETSRVHRTRGLVLIATIVIAIGVLLGSAEVLVLAIPFVAVVLSHWATTAPSVSLAATREFSTVSVVPGETVTVEVTVENTGDAVLPDLRIRDVIPDRLTVVAGESSAAVSLEPGETRTLAYEVIARRGRHTFDTVEVVCRNTSGSVRDTRTLSAERTLVAEVGIEELPLASTASQYAGRLDTPLRGSGVEFFATREYHPSDAIRDIDWRTYAKTGEFTTIEYKDTRAATIHLVVDNRDLLYSQAGPRDVTTGEMCLYAAELVAATLIEDRHQVGLTSVGRTSYTRYPDNGQSHYRELRQAFAHEIPAQRSAPVATGGRVEEPDLASDPVAQSLADDLVDQTAAHAQFVCITGLYDPGWDRFLQRLASHGRPVLVISPRLELEGTPGTKLAFLRRTQRIEQLQRHGIRVLDWNTNESLRLAIRRRLGGLSA